jgi:hypothetical protein
MPPHVDLHSLGRQILSQGLPDRRVLGGNDPWQRLEYRYLYPESGKHLRELEPDGAGPNHD